MANHCIDVTCSICGSCWCARGCSDGAGPSTKRAEAAKQSIKQGKAIMSGEYCCKVQKVIMGIPY